jgi:haloalkane dehalogenase
MFLRLVIGSRPMRWLNRSFNLLPWLVATVGPLRRRFSAAERRVLTGQYDTPQKRDRVVGLLAAMGRDDAFMRHTAAAIIAHLAHIPTLLLFGQLDPVRLTGAIARYRAMFHRTEVRCVPGEKHFPVLAAGEEVGRIVADWIARLDPRPDHRTPAQPRALRSGT